MSFADKNTEKLWNRQRIPGFDVALSRSALKKLLILDAANVLEDLRIPPGNRLESLKGDRKGQHSIRVNSQWRICFVWTDLGVANVELVDYH